MPSGVPSLGQGLHYWRVRALAANSDPVSHWSAAGIFTVNILKSPRNGGFTTDRTPTFSWYAVAGATYTLIVDDDEDFSSPIANFCTVPTRTSCTPTTNLNPGTYYWKVNINGVDSPVSWSFIVTPSIPGRPVLTAPNNAARLLNSTPTLDWNPVAGTGITYQLLVDDASNFKTPVLSPPAMTDTVFTFSSELADGRYYWKVRAVNEYGVPGPWSLTRNFTVDAILMISPANNASTTLARPTFRWGSAGAGATYQLRVYEDMGLTSPVPTCAASTATRCTLTTNLTPGVYYWRVDVNGQVSPHVWTFIYTLPPPLAPVPGTPAHNALVNDNTPTLSWMPATGAASYEVQVARSTRFNPIIFTVDEVTTPFTTITTPLTDGRYYWRVRSVNNLGVPGRWSVTRIFYIDTIPPTAPGLISPAMNAILSDSTPLLRWGAISGIRRYWVQIASDAAFNNLVINANQVATTSYTVPNNLALSAGVYYWRVRAIDPAGNIGPAVPARSFTIN
jgi:hypothetical protein